MPIPAVNVTIQDGALGQLPEATDNIHVKVGVSSVGAVNTLYSIGDPKLLKDTLGTGPLVESASHALAIAGGPVYLVRIAASVTGAVGAVTKTGTGVGAIAIGGAPLDAYQLIVQVTRDGANLAAATGAFKYSLDGGDVFSPEIAIPTAGTYAVPDSGVTLTFTDGVGTSFAAGDRYVATATAPGFTSGDLATALNVLLADPREWGFVHVVGAPSTAAGAATLAAAVDSFMAQAEANYRYAFAVLEAPDDTDANLIAAFANFATPRVVVAAGYEELVSQITGRVSKRSSAWPVAARVSKVPISEDLGRVATGSLPGVASLYRDEQATPGLDAQRFTTLRTIIGLQGFYVTNGKTMASTISDYQLLQFKRVMNRACKVARTGMLRFLNDSVRVDPATGRINELDARAIESYVGGQLKAALVSPRHASDASIAVKRDQNIISTSQLPVRIRVTPLGYAKDIEIDIGFRNPALEPKAA